MRPAICELTNCMECERKLIGRPVVSTAGRDKGTILVIIGVCDERTVLLSDGRRRKVERPKRKKMKHLRLLEQPRLLEAQVPVKPERPFTNRLLRETVKAAQSAAMDANLQ